MQVAPSNVVVSPTAALRLVRKARQQAAKQDALGKIKMLTVQVEQLQAEVSTWRQLWYATCSGPFPQSAHGYHRQSAKMQDSHTIVQSVPEGAELGQQQQNMNASDPPCMLDLASAIFTLEAEDVISSKESSEEHSSDTHSCKSEVPAAFVDECFTTNSEMSAPKQIDWYEQLLSLQGHPVKMKRYMFRKTGSCRMEPKRRRHIDSVVQQACLEYSKPLPCGICDATAYELRIDIAMRACSQIGHAKLDALLSAGVLEDVVAETTENVLHIPRLREGLRAEAVRVEELACEVANVLSRVADKCER